jgi:transposase
LSTKIATLADALGNPVELMLAAGQDHDLTCAERLLENVNPGALIGDKAFDADPLISSLEQRDITPVIPPRANRRAARLRLRSLSRTQSNRTILNKITHFRVIATRYDKLDRNFLAAVQLVSAMILLN